MQCIIMENTLIKLTLHDETKKRAHDSQIVRAKENLKLNHDGSSFGGKTLVLITQVPEHCYVFSYSQALFAMLLVYLFNKICIRSCMLRIFWNFNDIFSKLVPQ